jgi:hypothetical protein
VGCPKNFNRAVKRVGVEGWEFRTNLIFDTMSRLQEGTVILSLEISLEENDTSK